MNFPNFVVGAQPVPDSVESAKTVAAASAPDDQTRVTNAELMKLAGWTADEFHRALHHGLPAADSLRQVATQENGINRYDTTSGEPCRLRRLVLLWAREQETLAAEKLRLIAKLLRVK